MIVIGSIWWTALPAALCLGAAVVFAVRGATRTGDRGIRWAHALMALGMAGMFSPAGDPVPSVAGAVVFAMLGAWFAAIRLRAGGTGIDAPAHVAIGCTAMVVMYLGHTHGEASGAGHLGHAGHSATTAAAGGASAPVVALGLLLAGYFVWHAWESVSRGRLPARGADDARRPGVVLGEHAVLHAEPVAHVVMSGLMALMFLGAV